MRGFGINTPLARDAGGKIAGAAGYDLGNADGLADSLYASYYLGMPTILSEPVSQFTHNFSAAYINLLNQRHAIGDALQDTADDAEMTDLTIAKGFHTYHGRLPQHDAAPS